MERGGNARSLGNGRILESMARTQTGPLLTAGSCQLPAVCEGVTHIRAELSKSGSKCAPKVVAQGPVAARAKLQAVPLGVCKVEDHPWGCHSVCHLACAWELRALPSKEAKMAAVRSAHTLLLPKRTGIVSKMRESGAGIPIAGGTWLQLRTATWARPARP